VQKQTLSAASYEQYSPPASPLICRRPLSAGTEIALRTACTAVVTASEMQDDDVPAVMDSVRASEDLLRTMTSFNKHRSNDSQHEDSVPHPTKYSYKPDATHVDLFPVTSQERKLMQTKQPFPKRKEGSSKPAEKQTEKPQLVRGNSMPDDRAEDPETLSPVERPKTAPFRDSSDVSVSTPLSASTDGRIVHHASTTMTTAAVTPCRPSNRGSQNIVLTDDQYQAAVEQADAAAAEWMRRELEKRRQKQDRERAAAQAAQAAQIAQASQPFSQRPPSRSSMTGRARSLSNGIREYIRPRTASNSRPASRNGRERSESAELSRTPSQSHGWRSWGLQRKPSIDSSSGWSSSWQSNQSDPRLAAKKEIDLNRPLPALPSIDTYKAPSEPKPSAASHIANLMRPKVKEPPKESQARIINIQRVKVPPQALPSLQTELSKGSTSSSQPRHESAVEAPASSTSQKHPSHSKSSSQDSCFTPASSGYPSKRSMDLMKAAERARSKSQENLRTRTRGESFSTSQAPPSAASSTAGPPLAPRKVSFSHGGSSTSASVPVPPSTSSRPATRGTTTSATTSATTAATAAAAAGAMNFSRKISHEQARALPLPPPPPHHAAPAAAPANRASFGITALPPMPPRPKKSIAGLRRIVSSFSLGLSGHGGSGGGGAGATVAKAATFVEVGRAAEGLRG